jgi:hypothetical protein
MAHGAPDYSNVRKEEFVYRVDDMAELSARTHRGGSLERRGETVFFENFEHGLNAWDTYTGGAGASIKLTADEFVSKGFACELIAGSDGNPFAKIDYELPLLSMSKIGLEARFQQWSDIDRLITYIDYFDGTNLNTGYLRYSPVLETITIRNSDNVYETVLSNIAPPTAGQIFDYMKLVIDTGTGKYVRGMYNNNVIDLSDYDLYQIADTGPKRMVVVVLMYSVTGNNGKAIVDNIIVTRNET